MQGSNELTFFNSVMFVTAYLSYYVARGVFRIESNICDGPLILLRIFGCRFNFQLLIASESKD